MQLHCHSVEKVAEGPEVGGSDDFVRVACDPARRKYWFDTAGLDETAAHAGKGLAWRTKVLATRPSWRVLGNITAARLEAGEQEINKKGRQSYNLLHGKVYEVEG